MSQDPPEPFNQEDARVRTAQLIERHGQPGPREDVVFYALAQLASDQGWDYLRMALDLAGEAFRPKGDPGLWAERPDVMAGMLGYNLRLNKALAVRLDRDGGGAQDWTDVGFPAARIVGAPIYWVTPQLLYDLVKDLQAHALDRPKDARRRWIIQEFLRRGRRLDGDLKTGAFQQLVRHNMANDPKRWRGVARSCNDPAVRVRLHYATKFITGQVVIAGKMVVDQTWMLPGDRLLGAILKRKDKDYHYAARMLSNLVYGLLTDIRGLADINKTLGMLEALYAATVGYLLKDLRVIAALRDLPARPTLVVTTHGVLSQFPIAALWDGDKFLAEVFNVVQAGPIFPDTERGVGRLDLETVTGGQAMARPPALRVLADTATLAQTRHEADFYRGLADTPEVRTADTAWSTETLRWLVGGAGVGVLSSHVAASVDDARETAVVAPDGRALPISTGFAGGCELDLLVLAGCVSAAQTDWFAAAEGSVVDLARKAGAKAVISTLWEVSDLAARRYNENLVTALLAGASRATAHGEAIRAVMRSTATQDQLSGGDRHATRRRTATTARPDIVKLDHPFYWAPFVLTGAWS